MPDNVGSGVHMSQKFSWKIGVVTIVYYSGKTCYFVSSTLKNTSDGLDALYYERKQMM